MRGSPDLQMTMLTTVSTEAMVPADHPLRRIRTIVDAVLAEMDGDFEAMYSSIGRPIRVGPGTSPAKAPAAAPSRGW